MSTIDQIFAGPYGPIIIFLLRIVDVSLAIVRTLLVVRNVKLVVPLIAVVETLVWIFAVGNAIRNLSSVWHLMGYATGFAVGNLVGMWIEEKLAFGYATVRIITRGGDGRVATALRARGFGVSEFVGRGREGEIELLFSVVRRRDVKGVRQHVSQLDPDAFLMIEEPRAIERGWLFQKRRK
jgi:uncharacterized protein YebE (UPF0316 family)